MKETVREAFTKRPIISSLTLILASTAPGFTAYQIDSYISQRETELIAQRCLNANKVYTQKDASEGIQFAGNECLIMPSVKGKNKLGILYVFPNNTLTYRDIAPDSKYYKDLSLVVSNNK